MKIREEPITYFLDRVRRGEPFSMAGYSDAEWYCVLGLREGERTGLGQALSAAHGRRLLGVLKRRQSDPRFLFAVPRVIAELPSFCNGEIDRLLCAEDVRLEAWERDALTDDLARTAGLFPLIDCLRQAPCVLVGPAELAPVAGLLGCRMFVDVPTPNLHLDPGGIERAAKRIARCEKNSVVCVSAGVSAAIVIDLLHDRRPDSWFLDCGSIWDAFVGIGGQRQWRAELYQDPEAWEAWKRKCLTGR